MGRWVKKGEGIRKPDKIICELCDENNLATLHYHHIVPRTDDDCKDDWANVCVICSNCHNKVHDNQINIIGIFPSTKLPYKRSVIYKENGISNVSGVDETFYKR